MSGRRVTTIPAVRNRFTAQPISQTQKRKVAAYARVSTDHEEQLTSYEAQVDYYTSYIKDREDWESVHVYTDEGISATGIAKREDFKKMVEDALSCRVDLIVTKSVSRFARNTVDCLNYTRALRALGIAVIFEKENINTLNSDSEMLITMMGAFAQAESESISQNVIWGIRQAMREGKAKIQYKRLYAYERGPRSFPSRPR